MTIEAIDLQTISKLLNVIGAERSEDNDTERCYPLLL